VYSINYKFNKLSEYLNDVINDKLQESHNTYVKEMSYISTVLLQYINDILGYEKIDIYNIKELKRV
jgi:hypothetical protein